MEAAKEKVLDTTKSISEVAYDLGLNIHNFSRGFLSKKWEFRPMNIGD